SVPGRPVGWDGETFGDGDTLFESLLSGVELRDGRGFLKEQVHVCVPSPSTSLPGGGTWGGGDVCESASNLASEVVPGRFQTAVASARVGATGFPADATQTFDHEPSSSECPAPAQVAVVGAQWI